jgi:hypothetical protein
MQQSNDLRARMLKGAMTRIFEQSWGLLRQYDRQSLDYFWRKERITLEDAAFDNKYVLRPNGSVDGYSREREIQKLMQLRQLSQGAPWIVTPEIDRKIVELMDAQWVSDLYKEPQDIGSDQAEEQAIENALLEDGFVPQVKPSDDHLIHLQTLDGFIGYKGQQGQALNPQVLAMCMAHAQMHIQAARANPQYWKQHAQGMGPLIQKVQATLKGLQQQQAAAQQAQMGIAALRGGGMPPGPLQGVEAPLPPVAAAPPQAPVPGSPAAGPLVPQVPGGNGQGALGM